MAKKSLSEEKLQELIEGVPDTDDPDVLSYWQKANDVVVYLEGWADPCLAGTGFPLMEEGETARKIAYIEDLTPEILQRKAKEKGLRLLDGGFRETPDADYLYGVSYGICERGEEEISSDLLDLLPMPPDSGPPLPRSLGLHWPWKGNKEKTTV